MEKGGSGNREDTSGWKRLGGRERERREFLKGF